MTNDTKLILDAPKQSEWKAVLLDDWDGGIVFRPAKGHEPNWFHRFMQRLVLGVVWTKER